MKQLVKIELVKRLQAVCDLHGYDCPGEVFIHLEVETRFKYFSQWLCDAGLAELVAAMNEAAEKMKQ